MTARMPCRSSSSNAANTSINVNQGMQVMPLLQNKALNRKSKTIIFEIFTRYANVAVISS